MKSQKKINPDVTELTVDMARLGIQKTHSQGEIKVQAKKGKGSVHVQCWGEGPFALQPYGTVIPHKFQVRTTSDSHQWIVQTKVEEVRKQDQANTFVSFYRVFYLNKPELCSDWHDNPSAAYKEALRAVEPVKNQKKIKSIERGANGALIIGVTYKNLQEQIRIHLAGPIQKQFGTIPVFDGKPNSAVPQMTTRKRPLRNIFTMEEPVATNDKVVLATSPKVSLRKASQRSITATSPKGSTRKRSQERIAKELMAEATSTKKKLKVTIWKETSSATISTTIQEVPQKGSTEEVVEDDYPWSYLDHILSGWSDSGDNHPIPLEGLDFEFSFKL